MLSIIVAMSSNGAIGMNNGLPWHIPSDLKRFKQITEGHTIVMGRKTFESLPNVLSNRKHLVITRKELSSNEYKNVKFISDWESMAMGLLVHNEESFVIGGAEIYKLLMPYVDKMYITMVQECIEGDTYFPDIDISEWDVYDNGHNYSEAISGSEPLCNYLIFKRKQY